MFVFINWVDYFEPTNGKRSLTSHKSSTQVDCSGNIILGLPSDVFKSMIFLNMCKSMDNCALLESLCGWRLVFKGWKEMSSTNVIWCVFQMLQCLIGPMVRT